MDFNNLNLHQIKNPIIEPITPTKSANNIRLKTSKNLVVRIFGERIKVVTKGIDNEDMVAPAITSNGIFLISSFSIMKTSSKIIPAEINKITLFHPKISKFRRSNVDMLASIKNKVTANALLINNAINVINVISNKKEIANPNSEFLISVIIKLRKKNKTTIDKIAR